MAKPTGNKTALGAATLRLIEQYQPEPLRLFTDPVVKDFVGAPIQFLMRFDGMRRLTLQQTESVTKGIYGAQISRTRYIDDLLRSVLGQGIEQIVVLGAGLDTRPYRLPGIDRVRVYEVDLPGLQAEKKRKIIQKFGRLPKHVSFVPLDFDTQAISVVLPHIPSFEPDRPVFFIWEGVTQYVSESGVYQTLKFIGRSPRGSRVVFTYVLKSIIERRSDIPNADKMLDRFSKQAPWIFGLDPSEMRSFLVQFGLSLVEDVGGMDHQIKYFLPLGREDSVFAGERIVQAVVL